MKAKLTQPLVDRVLNDHDPGTVVMDEVVPGLRITVGKKSASYRLSGTINDGSSTPITLTVGRTDAMTVKQARTKAKELKLQLSQGEDPRQEKREQVPTVKEALDNYLASRTDLSPATVEWYETMVRVPLKHLAKRRMDQVTRDDCRRTHEKVTRDRGSYMGNACMRVLKLLHNDVARTIDLPPNPVTRAVKMNKERPRDAALPPENMPAMWTALQAIEDPIRRIAWETLLFTGLRSNDVKTMKWSNIRDDGVLLVPNPKGGEDRKFLLPLPRHLLQRLEELRDHTRPFDSEWCFPAPKARSGHLEALRRTEEFDYHAHQFRHNLRSHAVAAGVDLQLIQLILNHRPAGVTWSYLTAAAVLEPMRDAMEKIADVLLGYRP